MCKGKCPVCRYNVGPIWANTLVDNPSAYDVTCPKCKTELLIYKVNSEIYLREKPTYF